MAWGYRDRYHEFFPPSRPLPARGGIKAQSQRGDFGESWWARRWNEVLEGFQIGARLGRGRSYARGGQVLSIDIDKGVVQAKVQGSRPAPYLVTIRVKELSAAAWKKLARALSGQALFVAKLLAGEMPAQIEEAFEKAGLSLFPQQARDLQTDCSCPDWSNPCKHIAAVYYLLGEEFDRDPFLLFRLRGTNREELVGLLGKSPAPQEETRTPVETGEPLTADAGRFWSGGALPEDLYGEAQAPSVHAALPKRLGAFPFWRGRAGFLEAIEPAYAEASPRGLDVFVSKPPGGARNESPAPLVSSSVPRRVR